MADKLQDRVSRGYMFALGRRNIFRRLLKLAVAPIYYMRMTGQARSMLGGWPVDRMGEPVPMFTYPAITTSSTIRRLFGRRLSQSLS